MWDVVEIMQFRLIGSTDMGMNVVIINAEGISARSAEWQIFHAIYRIAKLSMHKLL
jgi:hypothetical protein